LTIAKGVSYLLLFYIYREKKKGSKWDIYYIYKKIEEKKERERERQQKKKERQHLKLSQVFKSPPHFLFLFKKKGNFFIPLSFSFFSLQKKTKCIILQH
jgi:hypothetical protein